MPVDCRHRPAVEAVQQQDCGCATVAALLDVQQHAVHGYEDAVRVAQRLRLPTDITGVGFQAAKQVAFAVVDSGSWVPRCQQCSCMYGDDPLLTSGRDNSEC